MKSFLIGFLGAIITWALVCFISKAIPMTEGERYIAYLVIVFRVMEKVSP